MRAVLSCLACAAAVLLNVAATGQDAAPADHNAINTRARPGGMSADSPVTFPKEGALPARYPPDLKEQAEPSEKDYFIFSSPCRSLAQIAAIQKEMPPGQFTPPPADWTYLRRTRHILTAGGDLRLLGLGDSIVNDTMRSGWVAKLQQAYPKARIQARVYVRGGGGCQHYREDDRVGQYILPWKPNLVYIGGISQKSIASIREVIRQLRSGLPEVEILLATGTFGTADPRDPAALAAAPHSGTGAYGQALKSLAAEEHCAYLDMTGPWAEYIRSSKLHPHLFYRDVVHANEYGEQILAKIMMAFWTAPMRPPVRAQQAAGATREPPADLARHSLNPPVLLPDGSEFTTWQAPDPRFTRTYFVNASHPHASDASPGTETRPFATTPAAPSAKPLNETIAFPSDASVLDARRDFGARGDGVANDTRESLLVEMRLGAEEPLPRLLYGQNVNLIMDSVFHGIHNSGPQLEQAVRAQRPHGLRSLGLEKGGAYTLDLEARCQPDNGLVVKLPDARKSKDAFVPLGTNAVPLSFDFTYDPAVNDGQIKFLLTRDAIGHDAQFTLQQFRLSKWTPPGPEPQ